MELPNIAAYAYQDVHVWSALLTCLRPRVRRTPWAGRVAPCVGLKAPNMQEYAFFFYSECHSFTRTTLLFTRGA